ncbi:MAG: sigma-70 family RNA polymerase sigma factor [Lactobacillales bacterium]|nr:sigma-70 family RNA polymerase sigma factor [Lactobacillales bacterium]
MKQYHKESWDKVNYKDYNDNEILSYINEANEEAIELIYEKYKPLINKIATNLFKKYCKNTGLDISDLTQEGMLGLNSAINHYKENKEVLFYTYAKTCIERKIISSVIAANRQKHKVLNDSISFEIDLDNNINLEAFFGDTEYNPENIVISKESNDELLSKIENVLTNVELQVLQLKLDGFEYKEIASVIDKDVKAVDNAVQRIRQKIKKIINESNEK